jgi:hypothetical protein
MGNFIDKAIFKNRHLSNATGRIRDESLMNLGGRVLYARRGIKSIKSQTQLI